MACARRIVTLGLLVWLAAGISLAADETGFERLSNGKELKGWQAADITCWTVEDGAITGRAAAEIGRATDQYLVWQYGEVDDFELKFSHRQTGKAKGQGGVIFRGQPLPDSALTGYEAVLSPGTDNPAQLYDQSGGNTLAAFGQQTRWTAGRESSKEPLLADAAAPADVKLDEWNDYHLIARGPHLQLFVNGKPAAETWDENPAQRKLSGLLALALPTGGEQVSQFKDIRLKRLKLTAGRKKIVLVAGKASHGPGEHEYNAGCALFKKCLDENVPQVQTAVYRDGWPADATAFDNADAILLYMNGGPKHPVMGRNRLAELDALVRQGVGLVCAHFAVEVPAEKGGPAFQDWIGGYYENGYSTNPHWKASVKLAEGHPITRGVKPFEVHDEWYFNMRFRPDSKDVTTILSAAPSDETRQGETSYPRGPYPHIVEAAGRDEVLMWAVERADGGRGVGFTGGHFHRNWENDEQRKLLLNALLWAAGLEVPAEGVSSTVTADEMKANLDPKPAK